MSVFTKLNEARTTFHAIKLEKTGLNKFAGYKYFELGDFLIPALNVFHEVGLCAFVSFDKELATMTIVDIESPGSVDRIVITSPLSEANLKGCHPVQNVGACETYARRYLWVAALEIVEHDALDGTTGKKDGVIIPARPTNEELNIPEDWKAYLNDLAQICDDHVAKGEVADAKYAIDDAKLENDQRIYLENRMNSKTRAALKSAARVVV